MVIQLWSCKWSNMWSGTDLTTLLILINCLKSALLKGFRWFPFSGTARELYAPKCGAVPAPLHPDIQFFILLSVVIPVVKADFSPGSALQLNPANTRVPRLSELRLLLSWISGAALPNQAPYQLGHTRIFRFLSSATFFRSEHAAKLRCASDGLVNKREIPSPNFYNIHNFR